MVMVNGVCSSWYAVKGGIHPGLVLEPVLFVIHINTMAGMFEESEVFLLAHDAKVFRVVQDRHRGGGGGGGGGGRREVHYEWCQPS